MAVYGARGRADGRVLVDVGREQDEGARGIT